MIIKLSSNVNRIWSKFSMKYVANYMSVVKHPVSLAIHEKILAMDFVGTSVLTLN